MYPSGAHWFLLPQLIMDIQRFSQERTPFYYYNLAVLNDTLRAIKDCLSSSPNYHVHYAIKACANPTVLRTIASQGFGADCVSGGEIQRAYDNGFPAEKIVFAGVGKADWEIELALSLGIACFNVESMAELEVIHEIATRMGKEAKVAFRINPNVDAHTHAKITTGLSENKFGIAMEDMLPAIRRCALLSNVKYVGLHFHIGSQITDMQPFAALAQRVNELQDQLDAEGIVTPSINVGGGLGIDYQAPDVNAIPNFADYFSTFQKHLRLREGQALHFELGRSIVAQCGSLITRVLYVKEGHHKKFVIVDAGMTDLVRPAMYGSYHHTENLSHPDGSPTRYDIVGPICESSDVFHTDYVLPEARRGDLIAFRSAGAYGEIMASQYNCRQLPHSILQ